MSYVCRDGIILTEICGEYLLVAATRCREYCPGVTQINETAADIWKLLVQKKTEPQIIEFLKEQYEIEDLKHLNEMIPTFIQSMIDKGYLVEEGSMQ